ncbi:MAG: hypothetical protein AAFU79_00265 [Myxococcota bacterium]
MLPLAAVLSCLNGLTPSGIALEVEDPRVRELLLVRLFEAGYPLAPDRAQASTVLRVTSDPEGWRLEASGRAAASHRLFGRSRGALTELQLQQYGLLAVKDASRVPDPAGSQVRVLLRPNVPASSRGQVLAALLSIGRGVSTAAPASMTLCVEREEDRVELRKGRRRCTGPPWAADPNARRFPARLRRWLDAHPPRSTAAALTPTTPDAVVPSPPAPRSELPAPRLFAPANAALASAAVFRPAPVVSAAHASSRGGVPEDSAARWAWRAQAGVQLQSEAADATLGLGLRFQPAAWGLRVDVGWTGSSGEGISVHEGRLAAGPEWSWNFGAARVGLGPRLGLFLHGFDVSGRSGLRVDAGADLPVSVAFRIDSRVGLELTAAAGVVFRGRRTHRLDGEELWRREPWHVSTLAGLILFP